MMNKTLSADWMRTPEVTSVMGALGADDARFVGGCVRNALLAVPVTDIDIATTHSPEKVIALLGAHNIKAIPTGIDHGTVTAVINDKTFEITTLRRDVKTDGRHAQVEFSDSWEEDAKRRDFTINTLFLDINGQVYDPTGQGVADLEKRHVVFVGDAEKRIQEDVLRILRFFRFHAVYGAGGADKTALAACKKYAHLIPDLSRERITQEFSKIIMTETAPDIIKLMFDHDVLKALDKDWKKLQVLCHGQKACNAPDKIARLFALIGDIQAAEDYLTFSKADKKQWSLLTKLDTLPLSEARTIKEAIYHHGRDAVLQAYLMHAKKTDEDLITLIRNWDIPVFPVKAQDLIDQGFTPGPQLGAELRRQEKEWLHDLLQNASEF